MAVEISPPTLLNFLWLIFSASYRVGTSDEMSGRCDNGKQEGSGRVGTWTRMPTCRGDLIIGDSGGGCA